MYGSGAVVIIGLVSVEVDFTQETLFVMFEFADHCGSLLASNSQEIAFR